MEETLVVQKKQKPIVSYWKSGDPCLVINEWRNKLTEINIFNTKHLTDEFIKICLEEKHRIFLHVVINGMGKTIFEPNIPTVKETFFQLQKLISLGFSQKQILVIVNPILNNDNGLKALKLLLKVFTEFKQLRLRYIRFNLIGYKKLENGTYILGNENISSRQALRQVMPFLSHCDTFITDYYKLISDYKSIITVDKGDEALIGIRELIVFGYKNEWIDENGKRDKIIFYEKNNKYKPIVNILSTNFPVRCANKCLLCPWKY